MSLYIALTYHNCTYTKIIIIKNSKSIIRILLFIFILKCLVKLLINKHIFYKWHHANIIVWLKKSIKSQ